ncbi:hypothetical protein PF005_g23080 [Phytophthora fragariae]|uniref:Crinkler effector protein N-terminal domain-containing protein n=2 Tax=Phytophthora fragariae TaxID=53985 RepID=A0A6A3E6T3_9STRA|nr:hypothetical protein PF003_g13753 [Phytophthora fragariae]KAE8926660.1 hypothetical protein PF009_g23155 [Phytophthora fragariae]KAE8981743.1 hypothetical protein PF011_g21910 [Phytophthora fragariae]KAE9106437.1 hypothetical protein PF006_g21367 [Phytophthora fragariae]KAE9180918.1 hypothetical protein PF005_g23080 [Phytophthora fragariae]
MVKLFCALAGVLGNAFPVDIDAGQTVGDLKKAIKKEKRDTIKGEPDKLNLFLAKTEDGEWLLQMSDVGKKLEGGETTPEEKKMIAENKMMPSWTIQDVLADFKMTGELAPSSNQIHVLVVLPDRQQSGSIKKQMQYKRMSVEASCRKFLDVLAEKFAELYVFDCITRKRPSMGDVFNAVRNNCWRFRLKRGRQSTMARLPEQAKGNRASSSRMTLSHVMEATYSRILRQRQEWWGNRQSSK